MQVVEALSSGFEARVAEQINRLEVCLCTAAPLHCCTAALLHCCTRPTTTACTLLHVRVTTTACTLLHVRYFVYTTACTGDHCISSSDSGSTHAAYVDSDSDSDGDGDGDDDGDGTHAACAF